MGAFSTAEAIARWNELLAAKPDLNGAVAGWSAHFTERDLELDGRPLCTVLRPHLVAEERLAQQARVAALLLAAVRKVRAALTADRRLYELHLGSLHDWIGHLLQLEPRASGEGALVRLDASMARTRLHFIETNADTPQVPATTTRSSTSSRRWTSTATSASSTRCGRCAFSSISSAPCWTPGRSGAGRASRRSGSSPGRAIRCG